MYEHLDLRQDGDVVWATMNRPERLNALNRKLVEELRDFFVGLYWRRDVRVVVLCGAGGAFCAGLDLKERNTAAPGGRSVGASLTGQRQISEIVIAMRRCPQPIIACVDGAASGGGFALALASDVRIATPLGLRLTKEALNHAIDAQGLEATIAMEDRNQILASLDGDFGEGVAAFLEKRPPRYERREG